MLSFLLSPIGKYAIAIALTLGSLYLVYDFGYDAGYSEAIQKSKEQTDEAISELGEDAEQGELDYNECVAANRVWDFGNSKCK